MNIIVLLIIKENAGQLRSIQGQGDNNLESWTLDELADYLRTNPISLMAQNVAQEVFESEDKKVRKPNYVYDLVIQFDAVMC